MSDKMGLDTRKPVPGFCNQVMLEPACSATETSQNIAIFLEESGVIVLSRKQIATALIRL